MDVYQGQRWTLRAVPGWGGAWDPLAFRLELPPLSLQGRSVAAVHGFPREAPGSEPLNVCGTPGRIQSLQQGPAV